MTNRRTLSRNALQNPKLKPILCAVCEEWGKFKTVSKVFSLFWAVKYHFKTKYITSLWKKGSRRYDLSLTAGLG